MDTCSHCNGAAKATMSHEKQQEAERVGGLGITYPRCLWLRQSACNASSRGQNTCLHQLPSYVCSHYTAFWLPMIRFPASSSNNSAGMPHRWCWSRCHFEKCVVRETQAVRILRCNLRVPIILPGRRMGSRSSDMCSIMCTAATLVSLVPWKVNVRWLLTGVWHSYNSYHYPTTVCMCIPQNSVHLWCR